MPFTPSWVADAIFYQIFPDRFANGDRANDPVSVEPWGAAPTPRNFFGGDLRGIMQKLPYLIDLGITAIYLNPVFVSGSNHKYNTADYLAIDPSFGSNSLFKEFLDTCHGNAIRVVIDGVFNHTGTDHRAFKDLREHGSSSQYAGWYNVYSYPVAVPGKPNYECWWNYGSLPKLMVQHPDVQKYLFDVTRYWTEMGIDGWRLDVANEIPHAFWKQWRKLVKSINPECYISGEIWSDASPWLQGDEFDAVMNYRFRDACLNFFVTRQSTVTEFFQSLQSVRSSYPEETSGVMQNLLGSHDTERILTICRDDVAVEKLAALFQCSYIGAPMIYYGDEIGMTGGKDPDCRRTMIWDESRWNGDLRSFYKRIIHARKEFEALRRGSIDLVHADNVQGILAYTRTLGSQTLLIALNRNNDTLTTTLSCPTGSVVARDILNGTSIAMQQNAVTLTIPGTAGVLLQIS